MESFLGSQIELSEETVILAIDGAKTTVTTSVATSIQTIKGDLNQTIDAVETMKTNLDSVNTGVASASVWITVVGLIATITLALELVIFVRKVL